MLPATNGEKGDDDICGCASGDDIDAGAKEMHRVRFCFISPLPLKIPLVFATEPPFPNVLLVLAGADDGVPPNGELLFVVVVLHSLLHFLSKCDPNGSTSPKVVKHCRYCRRDISKWTVLLVFCAFDAQVLLRSSRNLHHLHQTATTAPKSYQYYQKQKTLVVAVEAVRYLCFQNLSNYHRHY